MKREPRITMAKEVLRISSSKVVVDYDFRNDSSEDITTEVAFPIPDYDHDLDREGRNASKRGFDDFQLWIDGAATRYQTEVRAFLKDAEYTDLLTRMHLDIASFGHTPIDISGGDIEKLAAPERKQLEKLGLVDDDGEPLWRVKKKYYWKQTFSAHKIVHIRHEYTPIVGASNNAAYGMGGPHADPCSVKQLNSFCIDNGLHAVLQNVAEGRVKGKIAWYTYVDFILTTANTWKTPIEDFTLIVERKREKDSDGDYVSFCWDGPVTKIDADDFSAQSVNLVPTKELRIGFFHVTK